MAEMSRKTAICLINTRFSIMDYVENADLDNALDKAISDMEKLEKIENELYFVNNAEFETPNNAYTFLDRIDQILKGGE